MSTPRRLLPFQPISMTTAQLAAVSFLARYTGHTHELYSYQLRRWFEWCESNGLDPLVGIQRAHVELSLGILPLPLICRSRPMGLTQRRADRVCPCHPRPAAGTRSIPPPVGAAAVHSQPMSGQSLRALARPQCRE
jgi:hypothetical protein